MYAATTLCYVRTDEGEVEKVAEGGDIPANAVDTEIARLLAAGAIAEAATTETAKRSSSAKSGT